MPDTIHAAEAASLATLTSHLSARGVGPARLRTLVSAMSDALAVAADLVKTHPDDAERALLRISRYLGTIADDYAATPEPDPAPSPIGEHDEASE